MSPNNATLKSCNCIYMTAFKVSLTSSYAIL